MRFDRKISSSLTFIYTVSTMQIAQSAVGRYGRLLGRTDQRAYVEEACVARYSKIKSNGSSPTRAVDPS